MRKSLSVEAELVLAFLGVAFDAPAEIREAHELPDLGLLRQGSKPVPRGFAAALRPFDQQPLDRAGLASFVVTVRGSGV